MTGLQEPDAIRAHLLVERSFSPKLVQPQCCDAVKGYISDQGSEDPTEFESFASAHFMEPPCLGKSHHLRSLNGVNIYGGDAPLCVYRKRLKNLLFEEGGPLVLFLVKMTALSSFGHSIDLGECELFGFYVRENLSSQTAARTDLYRLLIRCRQFEKREGCLSGYTCAHT